MISYIEKSLKKAMSLNIGYSDNIFEIFKDELRNCHDDKANQIKSRDTEYAPSHYTLFLPPEKIKEYQDKFPVIKEYLENFLINYSKENGYKTASQISLSFREAEKQNESVYVEAFTSPCSCSAVIAEMISGKEYSLVLKNTRIGRASDNDIILNNKTVSAYHAAINYENNKVVISDLDSSNGSFVNYRCIKSILLNNHDVINFAKIAFLIKISDYR